MALIREHHIDTPVSQRGGCELWSPYSNGIYYITIEDGRIVVRGWDQRTVLASDGPVTIAGPHVSAHFANPGHVIVTLVGFKEGQGGAHIATYLFPLQE